MLFPCQIMAKNDFGPHLHIFLCLVNSCLVQESRGIGQAVGDAQQPIDVGGTAACRWRKRKAV